MTAIFISHSSKDNAWAQRLKAWLEDKQHRSLFLDFDRETGLKAGDLWEQQLYAKLRQCQSVLALVSRDWLGSPWCIAEAILAREKGKRLILARIDDADISRLFRDAQHLDFVCDEADAFARLEVGLAHVFDIQPGREPYPGLVPFDERDAGVFVGRDPEIASLLEMLESTRLKSRSGERLLLLLGASGSGKSSLVRAGVLPRVRRLPERWQVLPPMQPGLDPLRELAFCLAAVLGQDLEAVASRLAPAGRDGGPLQVLTDEIRLQARQPEAAVHLVLDQMEELLGLSEAQACGRFLDLLRRALEHGDGRFLVLATLRSEYLGEVQLLPFLTTPGPLPYREQTLDPVPLDRVDDIIRVPGQRWPQPVEFADRLVECMIRDTGTRDALPLLAFTLNRLWRDTAARADGVFQFEEYWRLGGLEGSVRTAADEALDLRRRTPAELEALRTVFVPGLVRVDTEGVRTRRRAFLTDLTRATRELLKPFVDLGLLVTNRDPEGRETIEVAHEALLRTWPHLDTWLKEDQDALRLLDGLERAARDWEDEGRSPDLLAHRGARLADMQDLLGQARFRLSAIRSGDTLRPTFKPRPSAKLGNARNANDESSMPSGLPRSRKRLPRPRKISRAAPRSDWSRSCWWRRWRFGNTSKPESSNAPPNGRHRSRMRGVWPSPRKRKKTIASTSPCCSRMKPSARLSPSRRRRRKAPSCPRC